MAKKDDFDWIDDPFNDKKAAEQMEQARMGSGMKLALGCGCLIVVIGVVVLGIVFALGLLSTMEPL